MLTSLLAACIIAITSAALSVVNTTVEYSPSPLALDLDFNPTPRFAFALDNSGSVQPTSFQIIVIDTTPAGNVVWDSGLVNSTQSSQILYGSTNTSTSLLPEGDYLWTVCACAGSSSNCACSVQALFSCAPSSSGWASSAVFIGGFPALRTNFPLSSSPITRARLYVSGVGVFEAWVNGVNVGAPNGVKVGASVLAPGWSTVATVRVLAHAYDVSSMLVPGAENVLGVRTGMGKYGYMGVYCTGGEAACNAATLRLVVTQCPASGACFNSTIESDATNWTGSDSPIVYDHLFNGETYNASAEQPGWAAPAFVPPTGHSWSPAVVMYPNISLLSGWDTHIRVSEDRVPLSVGVNVGPPVPVVSDGEFVKSTTSPDIYWVANGTSTKNFVVECVPCPSLDACALFVTVPESYIDGLADGPNFTCAMLPTVNSSSFVFDLGRNMAGFCTLSVPVAPFGTQFALVHGEILTVGGAVENTYGTSDTQRQCGVNSGNCADQLDVYFSSGAAATYTPTFTFHGFRYVGLFGWPSTAPPPTIASLTCHVVSTSMAAAGSVSTNSTVLNAIQAAIVATQRSNMYSHPSDCPTREKRGWLGDAQVTVDEAFRNLDAISLYENWARVLAETISVGCTNPPTSTATVSLSGVLFDDRPPTYQCCGDQGSFGCQPGLTPMNATGSLPDVVPYEVKPYGGWPGDFIWQVAEEAVAWAMLQASGDVSALTRLYPALRAHVAFATAATAASPGGLLAFGYYGDWNAGSGASTPFVENANYVLGLQHASVVASAVGEASDAVTFAAHAILVTESMVAQLFNSGTGVWDNGGANAQAMALSVGLGPANATASIVAQLNSQAAASDYHPNCGLATCRYILQGLTIANASAALTMATLETAPSWGYMTTPDMPGTIWEAWGGDAHNSDGSKNHPMFCSGMGVWLYDDLLGLRVANVPKLAQPMCPPLTLADEARCDATLSSATFVLEAGLTQHDRQWLCAVLEEARKTCAKPGGEGGCSYATLRAAVADHASACDSAARRPSTLTHVVTAAPHAAIVTLLGSASGWRSTPGHASLEWRWTAPPRGCDQSSSTSQKVFIMHATMPAGAADAVFGLGVPLTHVAAAAAAACELNGPWTIHVTASYRALPSHEPRTVEYSFDMRGAVITGYALATGSANVSSSPFTAADLVSRAGVAIFSSTGGLVNSATTEVDPTSSDKSVFLLQSVLPGLYEVLVELRGTAILV